MLKPRKQQLQAAYGYYVGWASYLVGTVMDVGHDPAKNRRRFALLHKEAEQIVRELVSEFRVQRSDAFGLNPELEGRCELARASVRLAPEDPSAAPSVISFSSFPGIQMRLGHWHLTAFPTCGCDTCHEEVQAEIERMRNSVADVGFIESIYMPTTGNAWLVAKFWGRDRWSGPNQVLDRVHAEDLVSRSGGSTFNWQPWPPRHT
jgi:hypothetical protein